MERADPESYQPPLSVWGHVWRALLVLAISATLWGVSVERQSPALRMVDVAVGLVCLVLVIWRRRWPLRVAWACAALSTVSAVAAGPAVLALVSLATRRRWSQIVPIFAFSVVSAQTFSMLNPPAEAEPIWLTLGSNVVFLAAVIAWGMYVGSRRELLWTLRQRAERAESEQTLRVAQARANERARIAREMHDVLAHRITQISMHAGALAFRDDLDAPAMRDSATLIRDQSHLALTDLRGVLGVLRDDAGELLDRPQPTYRDLPELVAQARGGGLVVEVHDQLPRAEQPVPDAVGRTLYRIIQEGLTNAAKHAPAATLTLELQGSPDDGVTLLMRNPLGFGPSPTPGSGLGLIGLAERAQLRGGRLEHRREGGEFVVRGWIPWAG